MKRLGEKLKQARIAKGLTQEQVAGNRMAVRTLQRLEDGDGNPTLSTLHELATALGVRVTDLLTEPAPQSKRNVYQLRADPKASQAMLEAHEVLTALAKAPPILRLAATYLLTGDPEAKSRLLSQPGGELAAKLIGKLRLVP